METVERYIYAVTRRLPERARAEVELELRGLIEDLLEEKTQGRKVTEQDQNEVLTELGDPEALAKEYGGEPRYLIGPSLYDSYLKVLKTVGSIALALVELVVVIRALMAPMGIVAFITEFLTSLVSAGFQVFGWVTLVFWAVEYSGKGEFDKGAEKVWTPALLPEIPVKEKQISISDPLMSIGVSILFLVMYVMPQRFGVFQAAGSTTTVIPVVNLEMTSYFLPLFIGFVGITIVKELFKLVGRVWSKRLATVSVACNAIAIVLAYFIFANPEFWNPSFVDQLLAANLASVSGVAGILQRVWPQVTGQFVYIVVIAYVIDTIGALYRGFMFGRARG
jgi:hypothetical protein